MIKIDKKQKKEKMEKEKVKKEKESSGLRPLLR